MGVKIFVHINILAISSFKDTSLTSEGNMN